MAEAAGRRRTRTRKARREAGPAAERPRPAPDGGRRDREGDPGAPAQLCFRAPAQTRPLATLLGWALPRASAQLRDALIAEGRVRVAGVPARSAHLEPAAGVRIEVDLDGREEVEALAAGADLDGERIAGTNEPRPEWTRAWVVGTPWRSGQLAEPPAQIGFEVTERRGEVAELALTGAGADARALARALARAGIPVVGDVRFGGVVDARGLHLEATPEARARHDWPSVPVRAGAPPGWGRALAGPASADPPDFAVSQATARVLERGHPWIVEDDECDDPGRFCSGAVVRLRDPRGRDLGLAVVDGDGRIAARRWSAISDARGRRAVSTREGAKADSSGAGVEARLLRAFERRAVLHDSAETNAYRLVHGEADGLPGLAIDRLGSVVRALVHGRAALGYSERALRRAADFLRAHERATRSGSPPTELVGIEVLHTRRPRSLRPECVRVAFGDPGGLVRDDDGALCVCERGLRYAIDLGLADPQRSSPGVGLFLDQRENRARLARLARGGGRWLNLFAHTGAFSVALLAGGASEVVSVDLSAAYLERLEANLARNAGRGVDCTRHRGVRREGRRFLTELAARERFRGIVLDPPTAAAAGRNFWSVKRDLEPLIEESLEHLEPSGWLLVCRNDRPGSKGGRLEASVRASAERAGVRIARIDAAPPGPDFPRLPAFPEGDPFVALLLQRA